MRIRRNSVVVISYTGYKEDTVEIPFLSIFCRYVSDIRHNSVVVISYTDYKEGTVEIPFLSIFCRYVSDVTV